MSGRPLETLGRRRDTISLSNLSTMKWDCKILRQMNLSLMQAVSGAAVMKTVLSTELLVPLKSSAFPKLPGKCFELYF